MSTRVECWKCHHGINTATNGIDTAKNGIDTAKSPKEGDLSICMSCAACAIFTGDGIHQRPPTPEEMTAIESDPRILRARATIILANGHRERKPNGPA